MESITQRLERLEAEAQIRSLPARYARAADSRDLDKLVGLFADDVDCGRRGRGRGVLKELLRAELQSFYRSVHLVCGHVIDELSDDHASGTVYCRAEHEQPDRWMVVVLVYADDYVRRDGRWFFARRSPRLMYAVDTLERPGAEGLHRWPAIEHFRATLPAAWDTWGPFWEQAGRDVLASVTAAPVGAAAGPRG